MLLRTFSLALNNDPKLFKEHFFFTFLVPFSKLVNSIAKLLYSRSTFSNDKYPSCISLKNNR